MSAQLSRLNTNSRYLSSELNAYCRELTDTLPAPLQVCVCVCVCDQSDGRHSTKPWGEGCVDEGMDRSVLTGWLLSGLCLCWESTEP